MNVSLYSDPGYPERIYFDDDKRHYPARLNERFNVPTFERSNVQTIPSNYPTELETT